MEEAALFFFLNTRFGGFSQTVVKGSSAQWLAAREAMTLLEAVAAQLNYPSVHFHSALFGAFSQGHCGSLGPVGIFNLW